MTRNRIEQITCDGTRENGSLCRSELLIYVDLCKSLPGDTVEEKIVRAIYDFNWYQSENGDFCPHSECCEIVRNRLGGKK